MVDEIIVQEEPVSKEEPVSGEKPPEGEKLPESEKPPEGEEPKSELTPEQEARVQQLIAEETAKAVAEAKEAGRRTLQSEQDRNRNAERRARLAESKVTGYEAGLTGLDDETRNAIELAKYRKQDEYSQSTAQEDEQRRQQEAYFRQMDDSLIEEVKSWGIEPDNKGIDYASDAPDYFTGRKRFTDSLQKIVSANRKQAEEKQTESFKTLEAKLRKDLGLDSVDTTTSGGGISDSDADFKKGIGDGSLPLNKTNMARAKKLGIA